jgi:hypothetical protein
MTDKKTRAREESAQTEERKMTPLQWAHERGHSKKRGIGPNRRRLLSAAFETADVLYGWSLQVHHYGADSLVITQKDFDAAMAASAKYPTVPPHAPAVSQMAKAQRANFKPLKAHKD